MDKKKFLKIFEMAIESEEITEITLKIWTLMGPEYTTFGREKFNEMYEYYKNNSDERMKLKPYYINTVREIDFKIRLCFNRMLICDTFVNVDYIITEKEIVRTKNLIIHSDILNNYNVVNDFKTRQPIFI